MKKVFSVILSLIMLVSATAAAYSISDTAEEIEPLVVTAETLGFGLPQEGYYLPPHSGVMTLSDEDSDFYSVIYNALRNREEYIDISEYKYPYSNEGAALFSADYFNAVTSFPELYYIKTSWSTTNRTPDGFIGYIKPTYLPSDETDDELFEKNINKILSGALQEGMSDEEKALALYDYLINHVEYDYNTTSDKIFSAYGAVAEQLAVCQGYALAYGLLMNRCGIEWKYVPSELINHAWNMVKIGDEWYQLDSTWGDQVNRIDHSYFLRSDDEFFSNGHRGWTSDFLPECTSDKYSADTYPFNDVSDTALRTGTYTYSDGYFYVKSSLNNRYFKVTFDGSYKEEITEEEYEQEMAERSIEPTFIPTKPPTLPPIPTETVPPTVTPIPTETVIPILTPIPTETAVPVLSPSPDADNVYLTAECSENIVAVSVNNPRNAVLLTALYDNDGNMICVIIIDTYSDIDYYEVPVQETEYKTVKVFLWENTGSMKALAEPAVIQ